MSYMEIYNEEINDLLAPEHRKLQIHENLEVIFTLIVTFSFHFEVEFAHVQYYICTP